MKKQKVFLITGSTQGIGLEIARQLLAEGNKVCLNGRSPEKANVIGQQFSSFTENVIYAAGDIGNPDNSKEIIASCIRAFGKLDVLILNAGISNYGKLMETSPTVVAQVINTNLTGNFFLLKAALPALIQSKGSVLLISSLAGMYGLPEYAPYSASKMALTALFQSLDIELKGTGVFVGITYVGFTENESTKQTFSPDGKLEPVPVRARFSPFPRSVTAKKIIRQINKKQKVAVHSLIGKSLLLLTRFLPRTYHFLLKSAYKKVDQ